MKPYNGHHEMVDPFLIVIDHRYQRPEKNALIQRIAQSPSWEAFGTPVCFKRANGQLYCADGQQRIEGFKLMEDPPRQIPIVWFEMEDLEDEAAVFVYINEWRKQLQPMEKYKAKLVAKDHAALAIERAVNKAGFTVGHQQRGKSGDSRTVEAIGTLTQVYNMIGEEGVLQTLTVIRESWPDDPAGLSTNILRGVANLLEEQGDGYVRSKVVAGLRKTTPAQLERKADAFRFDLGGSKQQNIRRAIADLAKIQMPR